MSLRASALVSCRWLADKLASKPSNLRVLDGSWHLPNANRNARREYAEKHIPGALFFDIDECSDKSSRFDHMLPPAEQFEQYAGKLGISNDTHIVVYDNNDKFGLFSSQRVWWTFRVFGHHKISVLNGGLPKWASEGFEVTDLVQTAEKASFKASFNSALVKSLEDLEMNIAKGSENFTVLDARPAGRFKGVAPEPRSGVKPGHMPDALNVPFFSMLDLDTRLMKSPEELREVFKTAGVDLDKPLVGSCGTGISACLLALGAYECGHDDVAVYDGSWLEWYQRAKPENKVNVPEGDL